MSYESKLISSQNNFNEICPKCKNKLEDWTSPDKDAGYLFYRIQFRCSTCKYTWCTRLEDFNVIAHYKNGYLGKVEIPSGNELQVRLDFTHYIVRKLMPDCIGSYQGGSVGPGFVHNGRKFRKKIILEDYNVIFKKLSDSYQILGKEELATSAFQMSEIANTKKDKNKSTSNLSLLIREIKNSLTGFLKS